MTDAFDCINRELLLKKILQYNTDGNKNIIFNQCFTVYLSCALNGDFQ